MNAQERGGNKLLEKMRKKIISRGASGMFGIQRLFKIIDDDGSMLLSQPEFRKACKDFRVDFDENEIISLFEVFNIFLRMIFFFF